MMRPNSYFRDKAPGPSLIILLWFVVGLVTLVLYAPFGLYFLNDDFIHVPLSEQAIFGQHHSIRVVNDFSLYIDSLLYGKSAVGYHFTNLLLHVANTFLLYFTSKKILGLFHLPNSSLVAHAAAMFFAIYPFHSEAVFWVIGRTGALSALWLQLALLTQSRKQLAWQLIGTACYLTGLFTYESVLVYPVLLSAIWIYRKQQKETDAAHWLRQLLLAIGATIAYILIRMAMLGGVTDQYESGTILEGRFGLLLSHYAALFTRLFAAPFVSNSVFMAGAVLTIIPIILLAIKYRLKWIHQYWKLSLLAAVLLASLLPYISLGIDTHGVESERYLYVPSLFLSILAAPILRWANVQQRWLLSAGYFVFASYFLLQSSLLFRRASAFAEQVVNTTSAHVQSHHRQIIFVNIPGEHGGAVLFRLGLPEAIQWLVPSAKNIPVQVVQPNLDPFLHLGRQATPMVIEKNKLLELFPELREQQDQSNTLFMAWHNNQLLVVP